MATILRARLRVGNSEGKGEDCGVGWWEEVVVVVAMVVVGRGYMVIVIKVAWVVGAVVVVNVITRSRGCGNS